MIDKELTTDIPAFLNFVKENDIETLFLPTSFLKTIFSESHYMDIFPSCVKHIQTAGEQLVISNRFREYLQRNNIYLHNHYGPAETHVVTTFTMEPQDEIPELPSIGKPILNTSIYILDEQRHLLPIGVPGELFIGGIQVGRGYFGKDELTKERFLLNPFEKNERLYKTGDLAKWLPNGNIQFLGRKDHQVKIRGFRVEPGEIETRLLEHNQIKEAAVTAAGSDIDRYLCAYFVSQRELELSELRVFLSKTLPDYMIPSYFIQLEKISLTPNGKVDRKALPAPQLQVKDDYVPPGNREEEKLVDIWADLLGIEKSIIGIDANFFELGGHSLKATIAISRIHKTFNVTIPHVKLFSTPTIRGLAGYIRASEQKEFVSIEPVEKREYYEISSAQKRLYVIQQMDRENIAYNLSQIYVSEKDPGKERLEKTFKKLIHRHESLRTSFEIINGNPVQRVHDNTAFEVEYYDRQVTDASNNFIRAFDLSQPPLLRVGIIKTGDGNEKQKYIFMVDMHHIISDGVSQNVLINDFMVLSAGGKPARLKLHYKDYTQWQNKSYESGELEKQEKFWLKEFAGNIPQLNIPMDFKRPEVQGFQGDTLVFEIGKKDTANLKELAKKEGATLFMVLLAFYNVLLSKLSGQEDIIVGTGAAGRRHADLERIIGMFVNTLSLRNYPGGDKSFVAFLREVKEKTIQAFENQDYLFETLVEKVVNQREANRNPLFDTVFMMQVIEQSPENKPASAPTGQELTPYDYEGIKTSMFELILSCIGIGEQITFIVFYRTTLFKKQTIEMFFQQFKEIISIVLENEKILLKEIDLSKDLTLLDKTVPQYSFEF